MGTTSAFHPPHDLISPSPAYLPRLFDLTGRVALVTGASQGLGRVMAEAFAHAGAKVLVNSRNAERCEAVVEGIRAQGGQARALAFDVGDSSAVTSAMEQIRADSSGLDILVNNVGIRLRAPLSDTSLAQFSDVLHANLASAFDLSRQAAALMAPRRWGRIIMVSSMLARVARPGNAAYITAKGGLEAMTRALAAEYGCSGIHCNAIAPGIFATEYNMPGLTPGVRAQLAQSNPLGRLGEPREIAGPALFLASEAASYITGQVLSVDGGTVAWLP